MLTMRLSDHLEQVAKRKAELGIVEDEAYVDSLRNKGQSRTPVKRELLRRAAERARAAGVEPVKAYY